MDSNFPSCLAIVLQSEGGFTDTIADGSGATNMGITLQTLSGWRGHPQTIADVEALMAEEAGAIYKAEYWGPSHCGDWPMGVDLMTFDAAVNTGVGRAIRLLQTCVGVAADGLVGMQTLKAVLGTDPAELITRLADMRDAYYRSLPTFSRFGRGWLDRVSRTAHEARVMVAGQHA